ncbi:hypothetical protein MHYP_G00354020 [Metynnis hypsauchen]
MKVLLNSFFLLELLLNNILLNTVRMLEKQEIKAIRTRPEKSFRDQRYDYEHWMISEIALKELCHVMLFQNTSMVFKRVLISNRLVPRKKARLRRSRQCTFTEG